MTESEARDWIGLRFGDAAVERVAAFASMVVAENERQNLIAPSTVNAIWTRHIVDSAQLVAHGKSGLWIDVGTGGGFPGMIVALLRPEPLLMVEPRRRRAAFLGSCVQALGLSNARVLGAAIEKIEEAATTISARAVASIEKLLQIASGCARGDTRWLLPRGKVDEHDLAFVRRCWQGVFHVEQSVTDEASSIIILDRAAGQ